MYRSEMFIQPIKTEFPYLSGQTEGESFPGRVGGGNCGPVRPAKVRLWETFFFLLPMKKVSTPQKFIEILYYYTKIDSLFPSVYVTPLWSLCGGKAGSFQASPIPP